jgi:hypothetical protein
MTLWVIGRHRAALAHVRYSPETRRDLRLAEVGIERVARLVGREPLLHACEQTLAFVASTSA